MDEIRNGNVELSLSRHDLKVIDLILLRYCFENEPPCNNEDLYFCVWRIHERFNSILNKFGGPITIKEERE